MLFNSSMDAQTQTQNAAADQKRGYVSLPPEQWSGPEPIFTVRFIAFTFFAFLFAVAGGLAASGRLSLLHLTLIPPAAPHIAAQAVIPQSAPASAANPARHWTAPAIIKAIMAAPPAPAPVLQPGTFTVTSIALGQPSIAIINGTSHVEGDPLEAPGVTGWKIRQILEEAVIVQNGSTLASLPLSTPGLKPLDDQLHPLN